MSLSPSAENLSENSGIPEPVSCAEMPLPGKYINIVNKNSELFRINVRLNGTLFSAVVDTGAACSLISNRLVDIFNFPIISCRNKFDALGSDVF